MVLAVKDVTADATPQAVVLNVAVKGVAAGITVQRIRYSSADYGVVAAATAPHVSARTAQRVSSPRPALAQIMRTCPAEPGSSGSTMTTVPAAMSCQPQLLDDRAPVAGPSHGRCACAGPAGDHQRRRVEIIVGVIVVSQHVQCRCLGYIDPPPGRLGSQGWRAPRRWAGVAFIAGAARSPLDLSCQQPRHFNLPRQFLPGERVKSLAPSCSHLTGAEIWRVVPNVTQQMPFGAVTGPVVGLLVSLLVHADGPADHRHIVTGLPAHEPVAPVDPVPHRVLRGACGAGLNIGAPLPAPRNAALIEQAHVSRPDMDQVAADTGGRHIAGVPVQPPDRLQITEQGAGVLPVLAPACIPVGTDALPEAMLLAGGLVVFVDLGTRNRQGSTPLLLPRTRPRRPARPRPPQHTSRSTRHPRLTAVGGCGSSRSSVSSVVSPRRGGGCSGAASTTTVPAALSCQPRPWGSPSAERYMTADTTSQVSAPTRTP